VLIVLLTKLVTLLTAGVMSKLWDALKDRGTFVPTDGRVAQPFASIFSFPFRNCGCPAPALFAGAGTMLPIPRDFMPAGLHRTYGAHHLHFITCSCYRRLPFLGTARSRDCFLTILEQARQHYRFVVVGYVVMPELFIC